MGKALMIIVTVVLTIYAFFDVLATEKSTIRLLPKPAWLVAVLIFPIAGPLAWIFFGSTRITGNPGPGPKRRPGPRGPDDDPDFLRDL